MACGMGLAAMQVEATSMRMDELASRLLGSRLTEGSLDKAFLKRKSKKEAKRRQELRAER